MILKSISNHPFTRFTTIIISSTLLVLGIPYVQAMPKEMAAQVVQSKNLSDLVIKSGSIEKMETGKFPETIFLIQDAHSIPSAQKNIQKIVSEIKKQWDVPIVGVEGGAGKLDTTFLKAYPNQKKLKQVLHSFLNKGELSGGTIAALLDKTKTIYIGLEDETLYEEGISLFKTAMQKQPELLHKIEVREKELRIQKNRIYPQELIALEEKIDQFYNSEISFDVLLKELLLMAPPPKSSGLHKLSEFILQDRNEALETALKEWSAKIANQIPVTETKVFNQKKQAFEISQVAREEYAFYLRKIHRDFKLRDEVPSLIQSSADLYQGFLQMKGKPLLEELEQWVQSIKSRWILTPRQNELDSQWEELKLIRRAARLELTSKEWKYMPEDKFGLNDYIQFYKNSERRDAAIYHHLIRLLEKQESKNAILIAGGFHAERLIEQIKAEGLSYVLIQPNIQDLPHNNYYLEHMKGNVSWKSHFKQDENGKIDLYSSFLRVVRDQLLENDTKKRRLLLKAWRDQVLCQVAIEDRLEKAHDYTRFIDELLVYRPPQSSLAQKVSYFSKKLMDLEKSQQWSVENISHLIQTFKIPALFDSPALLIPDSRSEIRAKKTKPIFLKSAPKPAEAQRAAFNYEQKSSKTLQYLLGELGHCEGVAIDNVRNNQAAFPFTFSDGGENILLDLLKKMIAKDFPDADWKGWKKNFKNKGYLLTAQDGLKKTPYALLFFLDVPRAQIRRQPFIIDLTELFIEDEIPINSLSRIHMDVFKKANEIARQIPEVQARIVNSFRIEKIFRRTVLEPKRKRQWFSYSDPLISSRERMETTVLMQDGKRFLKTPDASSEPTDRMFQISFFTIDGDHEEIMIIPSNSGSSDWQNFLHKFSDSRPKDFWKGIDAGVLGAGSGVDVLDLARFGARSVIATNIIALDYWMTGINIKYAKETGQISPDAKIENLLTSDIPGDINMLLMNTPAIGVSHKNMINKNNRRSFTSNIPWYTAFGIPRDDFNSLISKIGKRMPQLTHGVILRIEASPDEPWDGTTHFPPIQVVRYSQGIAEEFRRNNQLRINLDAYPFFWLTPLVAENPTTEEWRLSRFGLTNQSKPQGWNIFTTLVDIIGDLSRSSPSEINLNGQKYQAHELNVSEPGRDLFVDILKKYLSNQVGALMLEIWKKERWSSIRNSISPEAILFAKGSEVLGLTFFITISGKRVGYFVDISEILSGEKTRLEEVESKHHEARAVSIELLNAFSTFTADPVYFSLERRIQRVSPFSLGVNRELHANPIQLLVLQQINVPPNRQETVLPPQDLLLSPHVSLIDLRQAVSELPIPEEVTLFRSGDGMAVICLVQQGAKRVRASDVSPLPVALSRLNFELAKTTGVVPPSSTAEFHISKLPLKGDRVLFLNFPGIIPSQENLRGEIQNRSQLEIPDQVSSSIPRNIFRVIIRTITDRLLTENQDDKLDAAVLRLQLYPDISLDQLLAFSGEEMKKRMESETAAFITELNQMGIDVIRQGELLTLRKKVPLVNKKSVLVGTLTNEPSKEWSGGKAHQLQLSDQDKQRLGSWLLPIVQDDFIRNGRTFQRADQMGDMISTDAWLLTSSGDSNDSTGFGILFSFGNRTVFIDLEALSKAKSEVSGKTKESLLKIIQEIKPETARFYQLKILPGASEQEILIEGLFGNEWKEISNRSDLRNAVKDVFSFFQRAQATSAERSAQVIFDSRAKGTITMMRSELRLAENKAVQKALRDFQKIKALSNPVLINDEFIFKNLMNRPEHAIETLRQLKEIILKNPNVILTFQINKNSRDLQTILGEVDWNKSVRYQLMEHEFSLYHESQKDDWSSQDVTVSLSKETAPRDFKVLKNRIENEEIDLSGEFAARYAINLFVGGILLSAVSTDEALNHGLQKINENSFQFKSQTDFDSMDYLAIFISQNIAAQQLSSAA